jgi:ABC-2 type transport system ATP-binding protein
LLHVKGIHKSYRRRGRADGSAAAHASDTDRSAEVKAVNGVDFVVTRGEIVGLLGPNGAGKTTTIKTICGLVAPDSGSVTVNGFDIGRERRRALRHISAVLEGNRNLYWRLSARENLVYFAGNRGLPPASVRGRITSLLDRFGLTGKADELVSNLSRGMQQKLAICVALLADTDVLLLDEPTLGLDVETGYEVRTLLADIARSGKTIVLSTHDMAVVEALCRRVVVINHGRVVTDDSVANLMRLLGTRSFVVTLARPLPTVMATELRTSFSVADGSSSLAFTVEFTAADDIFRLMDFLRSSRAEVESIERSNANFEHVFRSLVNGAGGVRPGRSMKVGVGHVVA